MKVHEMTEPWFGVLVTGTHDIEAAREAARQTVLDYFGSERDAAEWWERNPGKQETGRVIPAKGDDPTGVSWWWRSGYALGRPGVARAVIFDDRPVREPADSERGSNS